MSETVRVGVVGTSWWADEFHLTTLKSHPRAEIAAICGRNRGRAEEMAKKYNIPRIFTDYREMIEKGNLDALVVSTPDDLHYAMTMDALDAGLHVLCEKPMAPNAGQAKEMYERAEAVGVKHMVLFTYRWVPHHQYLKTLIDNGYLGRLFQCQLRFLGGYGRDGQYGWRFDRQRANGIWGDLGSHMTDFARWYVGDVARVSAHLATFVDRPGPAGQPLDPANDSALVALEFVNGAQGMIQVSAVARLGGSGYEQHITLYGASGTLDAEYTFPNAVLRGVRRDEKQFESLPVPDSFWGDVDKGNPWNVFDKQSVGDRQFIDAILKDQPISPNFYDGWKVQEVIDAAIESHRRSAWVSLPTA